LLDERDLAVDSTLEDTGDVAKPREGPAIGKMAAVSMLRRPDAEPLVLWLADAVLATTSDGRAADRRPTSPPQLGGPRPRLRSTAAAAVCSTFIAIGAARELTGQSTFPLYGICVMGRRARPKEFLAPRRARTRLARWFEAVIFVAKEPVYR